MLDSVKNDRSRCLAMLLKSVMLMGDVLAVLPIVVAAADVAAVVVDDVVAVVAKCFFFRGDREIELDTKSD